MMILCLTFTACNNITENINNKVKNQSYRVDKVKVDNHDYIVARTLIGYSYGISIIHSESCECKKKK